jgi:thiol-disulfide isomerase/thioredoxin
MQRPTQNFGPLTFMKGLIMWTQPLNGLCGLVLCAAFSGSVTSDTFGVPWALRSVNAQVAGAEVAGSLVTDRVASDSVGDVEGVGHPLGFSRDQDEQQDEKQDQGTKPSELEIRQELNRLLTDESAGLDAAVEYIERVVEGYPSDSELQLIAISLGTSRAIRLWSEQKMDEGVEAFLKAETRAKRVVADPKHLAAADPMLAEVFFHSAQAHALREKSDAMYSALDQAFDLGFERLDAIQTSPQFSTLKDDPKFVKYLENQKLQAGERLRKKLENEISQFESFEFDFDLTTVDGRTIKKSDFKGQVLVVDFWGTWCPPCREGLPHYVAMQEKYGKLGLQVIGLNSENDETKEAQTARVQKAIEEFKINYPCALIEDQMLELVPEFEGFPTTLLIDRAGNVRLKMVGAQSVTRLETAIEIMLRDSGE